MLTIKAMAGGETYAARHLSNNDYYSVGETITGEWIGRRSAQRDEAIQKFIELNGHKPSNNEIARLIRDTRPDKLTEISTAEVKAAQRARMDAGEAQTLKQLRQTALERGSIREQAPAAPSLAYAAEHTFERVSVSKDHELETEALRHGRGRIELPDVKAALLAEVASGAMLTARGEVATVESPKRERWMVTAIDSGINRYEPLGRGRAFVKSDRLRPEQKTAVEAVLASRDIAFNISGAAGTGKTDLLKDVHRGLTEARRSVVAVAPTATVVQELQNVGFPQAMTVARLLADPMEQERLAGQVLIVDEAGMVASKDMAEMMRLPKTRARGRSSRVTRRSSRVFRKATHCACSNANRNSGAFPCGKCRGRPISNIKPRSNLCGAIRREGFVQLEAMGAIRDVDWRVRSHEVCQAYREASVVPNSKGDARSVLVVAATHDEINGITHAIREDLKRTGALKPGEAFQKHSALNWTEAQKKSAKNYQPGQVLEFHKAVKGIARHESLEVVSADTNGIIGRKVDGQTVKVTMRQAKAFAVFESHDIEISVGDKLLLQCNWRDKAFKATNGELVTVASVEDGRIRLDDSCKLPTDYRQFTHGYAVTAHRSQGKTVDFEIIAAERMAQDLFYVSATRAREGLTVITSDRIGLEESIGVSGDRQSATELAYRAARSTRAEAFAQDDLFQIYQAQQQARELRRSRLFKGR